MNEKGEMDVKCRCWFCRSEMIWGADFDFEDYGIDGEGVVASLTCSRCGATAEFFTKIEE